MLYTRPPETSRVPLEDALSSKAVVVPVRQAEGKPRLWEPVEEAARDLAEELAKLYEAGVFRGERGEVYTLARGNSAVYLVGVGTLEKDPGEDLRRALAKAAKQLVEKYEEAAVVLDGLGRDLASEALIGFLLGAYRLEAFKSEKKAKLARVKYSGDVDESYVEAVVEGVYLARDAANAPPNDLYPERLAERVLELFSSLPGVEVEVFNYDRLVREGFGGIVNVGKGSTHKPALIIIHYKGGDRRVAVVGKTLVFDAGGIQVKPAMSMTSMFADKAGGAAVLGIMWAAAKLGLRLDLYGLLASAINVPSGEAYLPSDVITMWDGTRVDIGHTDAEGRLAIADAIAYAAKKLDAEIVIDLATLTGAAVVALGELIAALFTRDDDLASRIEDASRKTGELVWRMPMADVYKPLLYKSARLGDINNAGTRWGGAIYGALFLEKFSHGKRFVHLDIAGPGIGGPEAARIAPEYWPGRHAPGYGVRLVLEALRSLQST